MSHWNHQMAQRLLTLIGSQSQHDSIKIDGHSQVSMIPKQWFEESLLNHNFKVVPIFLHWSNFGSQGSIYDPFFSSFKTIDKSLEVKMEITKNLVKKTSYNICNNANVDSQGCTFSNHSIVTSCHLIFKLGVPKFHMSIRYPILIELFFTLFFSSTRIWKYWLHTLQLLLIRFTQQNSCCINKSTMKHMQILNCNWTSPILVAC